MGASVWLVFAGQVEGPVNVNLRFVSRLCWFCSIGVFATFSFSGVVQARSVWSGCACSAIDRIAALRSGTLLVWESGSPVYWVGMRSMIRWHRFSGLANTLPTRSTADLMDELSKARSQGALPDVCLSTTGTRWATDFAAIRDGDDGPSRFSPRMDGGS